MRSISDVLQKHGGGVDFTTASGKSLRIDYLTLKHMAQYEQRLQNRAVKTLADQKGVIPEGVWREMFTELMGNISKGQYAFGGEVCQASLTTITGVTDLMSILCGITPDEALELVATEGDAFRAVFDQVVRASVSSPDDVTSSAAEAESEKKG